MFGGSPHFFGNTKLADTAVLQFSEFVKCVLIREGKRESQGKWRLRGEA